MITRLKHWAHKTLTRSEDDLQYARMSYEEYCDWRAKRFPPTERLWPKAALCVALYAAAVATIVLIHEQ